VKPATELAMNRNLLILLVLFALSASLFSQSKEARQVDEFGSNECEDLRSRLDTFLVELQNNPQSTGFVIVYEGKYTQNVHNRKGSKQKTYLPVFGEAALRIKSFRQHFVFRGQAGGPYLFIDGGYREFHTVELWIVPDGAKPPLAKPTLDTMKYRKGRPLGLGCEE